jgi:tripartite-type tricarboxylate transporter receptor subunit TctC
MAEWTRQDVSLPAVCQKSQQVVIENKPSAGGTIAIDAAAHAVPDGYTMLVSAGAPTTQGLLFSLRFNPATDLAPLSLVGRFPNLLVVPNSSPWASLKEFISYAKANPSNINWASPGVGTSPYLAGELFKQMAGIEITHVPYRGVAAGARAILRFGIEPNRIHGEPEQLTAHR